MDIGNAAVAGAFFPHSGIRNSPMRPRRLGRIRVTGWAKNPVASRRFPIPGEEVREDHGSMKPTHRSIALLAALLLPACATPDGFQYAREVGSRAAVEDASLAGDVVVAWRFGTPQWVAAMCGGKPGQVSVHGCSMQDAGTGRCLIFVVAPHDFQDVERLAVLGHELWHCQGARHL
jgi:hypothetical protein